METFDSREINRFLVSLVKVPLRDDPLFRVVWSEDMLELRRGTFDEWYGVLLVRQVVGARRVRKYNYIKDRWILEQWFPPSVAYTDELPESNNGSYEPVYVFQDSRFNPLPLHKKVVEVIVKSRLTSHQSKAVVKSRIDQEFDEVSERESRYFEDLLGIGDSCMDLQLHFGEAVTVPSRFYVDSPNLRGK